MEKTPQEVKDLIDNSKNKLFILDVREQWEYDICHIKDSVHIPMGKIADNDGDLKILSRRQDLLHPQCHREQQ